MKNLKNSFVGILALIMVLALAACGSDDSNAEGDSSWLENANLDADETTDELYEKAKEEGKVVVYSSSSIVNNLKESFEAEYPGIKVEATKLSDVDMSEKIKREQESGVYNADVTFASGDNGVFKKELLEKGLLHIYKPSAIADKLGEPFNQSPHLQVSAEAYAVMYNTEAHDKAPITNWWDLTTPEWNKKILSNDPLNSANLMSLFLTMIQNAEDMEEAYKEKFGEDIVLDGTKNAGYEFIKRLMDNDLVLMKSGGDAVDGVATSTDTNPPLVIGSTVKLRDTLNQGYNIAMVEELKPKVSVPIIKELFVANNAENVSAAKLFISWVAGGEDGIAGFDALNTPGTWATRTDIIQDFDVPNFDELDWWIRDDDFIYENQKELVEFLIKIQ